MRGLEWSSHSVPCGVKEEKGMKHFVTVNRFSSSATSAGTRPA
jgi:hypothetical protein